MKIETKYDIGQDVWFVSKGKAVKDVFDMIHIHIGCNKNIIYSFNSRRALGLFEIIEESSVFPTKEELLKSL